MVNVLNQSRARTTFDMDDLAFAESLAIDIELSFDRDLVLVWETARRFRDDNEPRPKPAPLGRGFRVRDLVLHLRSGNVKENNIFSERGDFRNKSPPWKLRPGPPPLASNRLIRNSGANSETIGRWFVELGAMRISYDL